MGPKGTRLSNRGRGTGPEVHETGLGEDTIQAATKEAHELWNKRVIPVPEQWLPSGSDQDSPDES